MHELHNFSTRKFLTPRNKNNCSTSKFLTPRNKQLDTIEKRFIEIFFYINQQEAEAA